MPSFLELAGDEAPPKRKSFLDLAGDAPKPNSGSAKPNSANSDEAAPGAPFAALPPAMQAAVLADVQKTGASSFTVNGQNPGGAQPEAGAGRGTMPASAYAPQPNAAPAAVQGPSQAYSDVPKPGAPASAPPARLLPGSDAKAVLEAAGSAVGGVAGALTGLGAGAYRFLSEPSRWSDPTLIEEAKRVAQQRGEAVQNWVTAGPLSPMGDRYAGIVSNAAENLNALGPMGTEIAGVVRPAVAQGKTAAAVDRTMAGQQRAFEASKAPARVEPTLGPQPVAAVSTQAPVLNDASAAAAPAGNPAWYRPPAIEDANPQLRQAVAEASKKGPLDPIAVARHAEADTLPIPMALTRGQATQEPALLSHEQNARAQQPAYADRFNEQAHQLVQNGDAIRANAAPDVTATNALEHGQALIDSYKTVDAQRQADITAKYKALSDANGGQFPVDGQAFVTAADAALGKQMKGRYVPPEIAADLDGLRAGGPMTFEQFENLRTNLAAEGRKAERAGDGNRAAAVNVVRTALEDLPMTGEAANLKPLADAARQAARERFQAIRSDPAYRAAVNDAAELGDPSPLADKFVNSYVVKAPRANVLQMQQTLAADPLAKQTIASAAIQHLMKQAGADEGAAKFSQAGFNRALSNDLAPKADALFDQTTAHQLQQLGNVAKYTQNQPRGSFVNNSNTFVASAAKGALETAANAMLPGANLGTKARQVGGYVKGKLEERSAVRQGLAPGAGVLLKDVGKR